MFVAPVEGTTWLVCKSTSSVPPIDKAIDIVFAVSEEKLQLNIIMYRPESVTVILSLSPATVQLKDAVDVSNTVSLAKVLDKV